jgi:2-polyprenyl-6-methoxyphenol hydroxylase-like FAD-dependent oxidoreductase
VLPPNFGLFWQSSFREEDFNAKMTQDFRHELGQMTQVGERHSYPLIGVPSNLLDHWRIIGEQCHNTIGTEKHHST